MSNLDRFATQKNATEGVWVEPVLFGEKAGVEFLVVGADSDEAKLFARQQAREIASMKKEEREAVNWDERAKAGTAARIKGMRIVGNPDAPVELMGEKIENNSSGYKKLFTEIPELHDFLWTFSEARINFLSLKKEPLKKQ